MEKKRQSLFSADVMDAINGLETKPDAIKAPDKSAIEAVSKTVNFTSREPGAAGGKRNGRYYRTGRTVPFSTKISHEYNVLFFKLVDENGWKINETLEKAIAALKRETDKNKAH